ncbi:hypothetical protein GN956_G7721 [Arapaima gigas]
MRKAGCDQTRQLVEDAAARLRILNRKTSSSAAPRLVLLFCSAPSGREEVAAKRRAAWDEAHAPRRRPLLDQSLTSGTSRASGSQTSRASPEPCGARTGDKDMVGDNSGDADPRGGKVTWQRPRVALGFAKRWIE